MICPHCLSKIVDGAVFCGKCGKKITDSLNEQKKESSSLTTQDLDLQSQDKQFEIEDTDRVDNTDYNVEEQVKNLEESVKIEILEKDGNIEKIEKNQEINQVENAESSEKLIINDKEEKKEVENIAHSNEDKEKEEIVEKKEKIDKDIKDRKVDNNKINNTLNKTPLTFSDELSNLKSNSSVSKKGFSKVIYDPKFKKFLDKHLTKHIIINIIFVSLPLLGLLVFNFISREHSMSSVFKLGLIGSGILFLLSLLLYWIPMYREKTWDGVVVRKYQEERQKVRKHKRGMHYHTTVTKYTASVVQICKDSGENHEIENDGSSENYYYMYLNEGDRVRYHPRIHYYEKEDKSKDTYVLCPFCKKVCYLNSKICNCGAPLLI